MSFTKLKEIVFDRIPIEIFLAHEALGIYMAIAESSDSLNQSKHRHVFGIIQRQAFDAFVLSLCRLFEKPSKKYPNYSIPTVLTHFRALGDKDFCEQIPAKLVEYICTEVDSTLSDLDPPKASAAARMVCSHFEKQCPCTPPRKGQKLDIPLDALKVLRNKRVAHHEDHDLVGLSTTDFEGAIELLCFAQTFVNIVGDFYGSSMKSISQPVEFTLDKSTSGNQIKKMIQELEK